MGAGGDYFSSMRSWSSQWHGRREARGGNHDELRGREEALEQEDLARKAGLAQAHGAIEFERGESIGLRQRLATRARPCP